MGEKKNPENSDRFTRPKAKEIFLTAHYYLNTVFIHRLTFFLFIINRRKKGFSVV